MARHLLPDIQVQKGKPRTKPYRLADGDGLYLYVTTTTKDARAWQYRYRHDGKPQTLTLGKLKCMTLSQARTEADKARADAIPRGRMKRKDPTRGDHRLPLGPALLKTLRSWCHEDGKDATFVFPARRDVTRPITPEAIEKHYRETLQLAGKHSPHSWRSTFSTIARDAGKDPDAIGAQLDHVIGSKTSASYDRAKRLELRWELMGWYEGVLIAARDGASGRERQRSGENHRQKRPVAADSTPQAPHESRCGV